MESSSGSGGRSPSPEVLAAMRELQAEYGKVLPRLIEEIAAALREAKGSPGERGLLEEVRTRAHKLRGSAGSFGFWSVGEVATRVEAAAVRALAEAGEERWAPLEAGVAEMAVAAREALEGADGEG